MSGDAGQKFVYKMDHVRRGIAVIINNKDFERGTHMPERKGTNIDADNLEKRLRDLGFDVRRKDNATAKDTRDLIKSVAGEDHKDADCFFFAILTHGDDGGVLYATDGLTYVDEYVEPFKGDKCRSLVGKPKLFFIQACRGQTLDHGVEVPQSDGPAGVKIPCEADLLIAYSVPPGYCSFRSRVEGSWFIQAVCKVLEEHGSQMEIMSMMTRVNNIVAYNYASHTEDPALSGKKQMPFIVHMLTKELYFKPKGQVY